MVRLVRGCLLQRSLEGAITLVALCLPLGCAGGSRDDSFRPIAWTADGSAIVGVGFEPIATRTRGDAAQTVAHMELTGLLFLPGDRGLLVWEKSGRVAHYTLEQDALVLEGELHIDDIESFNDCGLVSLALDPDWEQNGYLYAAACKTRKYSEVKRYTFHGDDYESVADSGVEVIEFGDPDAPKAWHNVGAIGFFPDVPRLQVERSRCRPLTSRAARACPGDGRRRQEVHASDPEPLRVPQLP